MAPVWQGGGRRERENFFRVASILPALTAMDWVLEITATRLGETAGDLLSMTSPGPNPPFEEGSALH
jgi:hypothetical protein